MKKQMFLEAIARVSDTVGHIWLTGSLGVQYNNPKQHWVYELLKENPLPGSTVHEWGTEDNPHFPRSELVRLENALDPRTFRQMFKISWDIVGSAMVYDDLTEANLVKSWNYDPNLETAVAIDWGWTHQRACGFFQYDRRRARVILFDEIVGSRITREQLWDRIKAKGYRIDKWFCDIAGKQERESAISNIAWFGRKPRNVSFDYRASEIQYGLPLVRQWILAGKSRRRFFIDEVRCPKSVDGMKNYRYPEKDGTIQNENPVKENDDCPDMIRYYFVNRHDDNRAENTFNTFKLGGMSGNKTRR